MCPVSGLSASLSVPADAGTPGSVFRPGKDGNSTEQERR
jgi:hypothetical protein